MTKERVQDGLRIFNTAMSGVAVFLLISMYNRFEKKLDQLDTLQVGQATIYGRLDVVNNGYNLMQATFDNQLKQADKLLNDVNECEQRLDYLEMYADRPKPIAVKKK